MKYQMKVVLILIIMLSIYAFTACAPSVTVQEPRTLPAYSGPKASVVVARFDCRAQECTSLELGFNPFTDWYGIRVSTIGSGVSDAFITSLVQSRRFEVFEAAQNVYTLENELRVSGESAEFQGADLAIIGTITEFQPNASGFAAGGILPFSLGGVAASNSTIAMDLRVIEIKSRKIVAATKVRGEASRFALAGGGLFGPGIGGLSVYSKTPMEQAIAILLSEATFQISQEIPGSYFVN
jgi:curli biogenesis system outer membrane secretion channel CsgG